MEFSGIPIMNMSAESFETVNHPIFNLISFDRLLGPLPRALDAKTHFHVFSPLYERSDT